MGKRRVEDKYDRFVTPEFREYAKIFLEHQGREWVVQQLESICIACYDDESLDTLIEAYIDSYEAGDLGGIQYDLHTAKAISHRLYMAYLDVEEIFDYKLKETN